MFAVINSLADPYLIGLGATPLEACKEPAEMLDMSPEAFYSDGTFGGEGGPLCFECDQDVVDAVAADVVDVERLRAVQGLAHARLRGRRRRQEDVEVGWQHGRAAKDL